MWRVLNRKSPLPDERGFSLFESLVALAIFSMVAISSLSLVTQNAESVSRLEARSNAAFVAENVLVDAQLQRVLTTTDTNGTEEMGGYAFEWERVITDTGQEDIRQVSVKVRLKGELQVIASLVGFRNE